MNRAILVTGGSGQLGIELQGKGFNQLAPEAGPLDLLRPGPHRVRDFQYGRTLAVEPGDAVIGDDDPGVISLPDVARLPQHGVLVDVRSPDQYRGRAATLDPIGGHIPGAVNVPAVTHMRPDGRLRAPSEIASALAAHGIRPGVTVAVYCGSAVASTHSALAFELVGVDACHEVLDPR